MAIFQLHLEEGKAIYEHGLFLIIIDPIFRLDDHCLEDDVEDGFRTAILVVNNQQQRGYRLLESAD